VLTCICLFSAVLNLSTLPCHQPLRRRLRTTLPCALAFPIEQFWRSGARKAHTRRGKTNVAKMIGKRTNVYAPHDRKTTPAMFFLPRRRCVDVGFLIRKRIFFFKITTSTRLRSLRTCTKAYDLVHFLEVLAADASPCKKTCIWSAQGLQAGAVYWRSNRFTKQLRAHTHLSLQRSLEFEPEPLRFNKNSKTTLVY
jgi:hypothetical protein